MGEELRERVKERYAVAARSVLTGLGRLRAAGRRVSAASTRRRSGWTGQGAAIRPRSWAGCPRRRVRPPWGAATLRPLPRCLRGRWSWTWAAVAA